MLKQRTRIKAPTPGTLIPKEVLPHSLSSDVAQKQWMWELYKPIAESVVCIRNEEVFETGADAWTYW